MRQSIHKMHFFSWNSTRCYSDSCPSKAARHLRRCVVLHSFPHSSWQSIMTLCLLVCSPLWRQVMSAPCPSPPNDALFESRTFLNYCTLFEVVELKPIAGINRIYSSWKNMFSSQIRHAIINMAAITWILEEINFWTPGYNISSMKFAHQTRIQFSKLFKCTNVC